MYFILNNYGKPDADYLQVAINACESSWSMTVLMYLKGKEYSWSLCSSPNSGGKNEGGIGDTSFWHKRFCACMTVICLMIKKDIPVLDADAYRDQCCAQIKPEEFALKKWSYVKGTECFFGDEVENIERGEVKED